MPNHTQNLLTVRGADAVLDQVIAAVRKDVSPMEGEESQPLHFSCDRIVPQPPIVHQGAISIQDQNKKHPGRNWYDWNRANWGTKWGSYDTQEPTRENGSVTFRFQSAWSPPVPVIKALAGLFPDTEIMLEAIDEGWCWAMRAEAKGDSWIETDIEAKRDNHDFRVLYERVHGEPIPEDEE